jgi:2-oxoisovalerate dehydrogenase E2 component (dihydrolipoyl transacylase)
VQAHARAPPRQAATSRRGGARRASGGSRGRRHERREGRRGRRPVGFRGRQPGEVEPIRGIRKRIVEKMEVSRREIPAATCTRDADLTELWEVRKELTAQARDEGFDVKITPFALVMRAAVLALRRFPTLNARIDREAARSTCSSTSTSASPPTPTAGSWCPTSRTPTPSRRAAARARAERAGRSARDGSLGPGELTGGTFTVNNYGAFGNDDGDPIINHPEGGILGVGAIRERPGWSTGELARSGGWRPSGSRSTTASATAARPAGS